MEDEVEEAGTGVGMVDEAEVALHRWVIGGEVNDRRRHRVEGMVVVAAMGGVEGGLIEVSNV